MKCELAKDLIILYAEDLCSKETKVELEEHLEKCPECKKRLEEYKKELKDENRRNERLNEEEDKEALKPMKKVKRKLRHGKFKLTVLTVILLIVLVGLWILSYGQVTNECLSFSAIADTGKIYSVCKALSNGDTEPFMDIVAYRIADQYAVNGSMELDNFEEYIAQVEKDVKEASDFYFEGRNVTVKIQGIDQYPYGEEETVDDTNIDITVGFYEKNELLYELAFGKVATDKFIVYELPQNGAPTFTKSMLPFSDTVLDICLHYATKVSYNNLVTKKREKTGAQLALAVTIEGTDEEKNGYRDLLIERTQKLCDEGWYYKDAMYVVDEYDIEEGKWIYKVWFMIEDHSNGNLVMVEQKFHYYRQQLYVIDNSPAVIIGNHEDIPQDISKQIVEIFKK